MFRVTILLCLFKPGGWNGPYLDKWPTNPFNEKSTGNIESGSVSQQKEYQLDYRTVDSNHLLCIEVTLPSYDQDIIDYLDEKIDKNDGKNSGHFRYVNNNRWVLWVIEENPTTVAKYTNGNNVSH